MRQLLIPVAGFLAIFVLAFLYLSLPGTPKPPIAGDTRPNATASPFTSPSVVTSLSPIVQTPIEPTGTRAVATSLATVSQSVAATTPHAPNPTGITPPIPNGAAATQPVTSTWMVMSQVNAPSPRYHNSAVWTGAEMIVWGGLDYLHFFQDGARYNPTTNKWTPISIINAPRPRSLHAAVWTGTDMIVWAGTQGRPRSTFIADGGSYNLATDSWTALSPSPLAPRIGVEAVWTGQDVIFWGGLGGTDAQSEFYGDGARYNPKTKNWTLLPKLGAPSPRWGHSMVWTGHDVIVWGGEGGINGSPLNDGARYDPATNTWMPLSVVGAPRPRTYQATAWTGTEMYVVGGRGGGVLFGDGVRFQSATGTWTHLSLTGAPTAREYASAFWTGEDLLLWGGNDVKSQPLWDGALYDPGTSTWWPLPTAPLIPRLESSAIWTGNTLIVWGGIEDDESTNPARLTPHNDGITLRP